MKYIRFAVILIVIIFLGILGIEYLLNKNLNEMVIKRAIIYATITSLIVAIALKLREKDQT